MTAVLKRPTSELPGIVKGILAIPHDEAISSVNIEQVLLFAEAFHNIEALPAMFRYLKKEVNLSVKKIAEGKSIQVDTVYYNLSEKTIVKQPSRKTLEGMLDALGVHPDVITRLPEFGSRVYMEIKTVKTLKEALTSDDAIHIITEWAKELYFYPSQLEEHIGKYKGYFHQISNNLAKLTYDEKYGCLDMFGVPDDRKVELLGEKPTVNSFIESIGGPHALVARFYDTEQLSSTLKTLVKISEKTVKEIAKEMDFATHSLQSYLGKSPSHKFALGTINDLLDLLGVHPEVIASLPKYANEIYIEEQGGLNQVANMLADDKKRGKLIRGWRKKRGVSIKTLSENTRIEKRMIMRIEGVGNSQETPDASKIAQYFNGLGVNRQLTEKLLSNYGDTFPTNEKELIKKSNTTFLPMTEDMFIELIKKQSYTKVDYNEQQTFFAFLGSFPPATEAMALSFLKTVVAPLFSSDEKLLAQNIPPYDYELTRPISKGTAQGICHDLAREISSLPKSTADTINDVMLRQLCLISPYSNYAFEDPERLNNAVAYLAKCELLLKEVKNLGFFNESPSFTKQGLAHILSEPLSIINKIIHSDEQEKLLYIAHLKDTCLQSTANQPMNYHIIVPPTQCSGQKDTTEKSELVSIVTSRRL